jgi:hypothetical protein
MSSVSQGDAEARRQRRRSTTAIKESLRELSIQLSLLNHQVGTRMALKDVDFDCLDLINRHGPLSPTALARRTGLHAATMTGILVIVAGNPTDRRSDPRPPAQSKSSACTPE